jgi:hypothetical protein
MNYALAGDPNRWLDPFAQFMLAGAALDTMLLASAGRPVSRYQEDTWASDYSTLFEIANDLRHFETLADYQDWRAQRFTEAGILLCELPTLAGVEAIARLLLAQGQATEAEARAAFLEPGGAQA